MNIVYSMQDTVLSPRDTTKGKGVGEEAYIQMWEYREK